jgi:Kef-type K+ transport system membrane component KefB
MIDFSHIPTLLLIGCAILAGSVGARLFQWLRIPQVVGYIVVGVIIGRSGFQLVDEHSLQTLAPLNFLALGIIGFMIGGELHRRVFQVHGKQFLILLLAEGITAFLFVALLTTSIVYWATGDIATSTAFGLLLGAIASATAPAATVDVLWEYKTRGILTTTVLAIVALDDGLALVLFSIASSIASRLTGEATVTLTSGLLRTGFEIGGALLLGFSAGLLLQLLGRGVNDYGKHITLIVGILTLVIGLAITLGVDLILAAMALGATVVNLAPYRSRETFDLVERFGQPIYVLFFVFVGAQLTIHGMPFLGWLLVVAYVAGRSGGKFLGAYFGARWSGATEVVRRYLGLCLFSQAGIAIGLSIMASIRFDDQLVGEMVMGDAIIMIVTATTFIVQIIGPPCVKVAVTKAGEAGLNVTEEDLLQTYKVRDVADRNVPTFSESTKVTEIMRDVANVDSMHYAVTNDENHVIGMITINDLKQCLANLQMGEWLIAADLATPVAETVLADSRLSVAIDGLRRSGLEAVPVVSNAESASYFGVLELRACERKISAEVWKRRAQSDV